MKVMNWGDNNKWGITYVGVDFFGEHFQLFGGQLLEQVIHIDIVIVAFQLSRRHIVHDSPLVSLCRWVKKSSRWYRKQEIRQTFKIECQPSNKKKGKTSQTTNLQPVSKIVCNNQLFVNSSQRCLLLEKSWWRANQTDGDKNPDYVLHSDVHLFITLIIIMNRRPSSNPSWPAKIGILLLNASAVAFGKSPIDLASTMLTDTVSDWNCTLKTQSIHPSVHYFRARMVSITVLKCVLKKTCLNKTLNFEDVPRYTLFLFWNASTTWLDHAAFTFSTRYFFIVRVFFSESYWNYATPNRSNCDQWSKVDR